MSFFSNILLLVSLVFRVNLYGESEGGSEAVSSFLSRKDLLLFFDSLATGGDKIFLTFYFSGSGGSSNSKKSSFES